MKKVFIIIACIFFVCLIVISCRNGDDKPAQEEDVQVDKVLLSLPDAVNAPQSGSEGSRFLISTLVTEATVFEGVEEIFNPVRERYNPLASTVIDTINSSLTAIDEKIFLNTTVMNNLNKDGLVTLTYDNETSKARVTKNGDIYTVELWTSLSGTWLKYLHVSFSRDGDRYSGTITGREQELDSTYRKEYEIKFDTEDPLLGHTIELRTINIDYDDPEIDTSWENENIPTKMWLSASTDNTTFSIAANVYYTQVDIASHTRFYEYLMAILNDDEAFIPGTTQVNAHFIYRGAIDVAEDRGAIELALVPETNTDTTEVFSVYSIGEIYREAVADWVQDNGGANRNVINTINNALEEIGSGLTVSPTSSTEEIFDALKAIQDYLEEQDKSIRLLDGVLFVVQLGNPGYFDDKSGFVGNNELRRPAWADEVPGFGDLEVLSAADVAGSGFTVTMPNDEEPDF